MLTPPLRMARACVLVSTLAAGLAARAEEIPQKISLWPGAAPGSEHVSMQEKITERSSDPARHDRIYTQIVEPSLAVRRPAEPNGVAVIVAPGGGYQRIVIDKEGEDTAAWLNSLGVTAFVLKYRLPDEGHANGHDAPLQDAQRAMRLVRSHAAGWGLDPGRIGFLGYSAGGHIAASIEFFCDQKVYEPVDEMDAVSARPDFSILCYAPAGMKQAPQPSTSGEPPTERMQLMLNYRIEAAPAGPRPPTFIFQADDDRTVPPENALRLYTAVRQSGAPAELHIFRRGGHGFGIRNAEGPIASWPELCAAWMRDVGIIVPNATPAH